MNRRRQKSENFVRIDGNYFNHMREHDSRCAYGEYTILGCFRYDQHLLLVRDGLVKLRSSAPKLPPRGLRNVFCFRQSLWSYSGFQYSQALWIVRCNWPLIAFGGCFMTEGPIEEVDHPA